MAAVELTVFHVILLFWSLRTAESQVMTLSGCESTCGDIEIPYPFGMKEGCFLDEGFKIHCNSSTDQVVVNGTLYPNHIYPTLTVNGIDLVVRNISVSSSNIIVMFPIVSTNCGDKDRNTIVDLEGSPFVFSSENYFVASGCDSLAMMNQNNSAIGGCVSICDKNHLISDCNGINCCQTRIPSNLKVFNVTMTGVDGRNGSRGEKDCRYAYLSNYGGNVSVYSVDAVLDWGIDRRAFDLLVNVGSTCKVISVNSTIQSPVFQCSCNPGFEGNPYISGICQEGTQHGADQRKFNAKIMAGLGMLLHFHSIYIILEKTRDYETAALKRSRKRLTGIVMFDSRKTVLMTCLMIVLQMSSLTIL